MNDESVDIFVYVTVFVKKIIRKHKNDTINFIMIYVIQEISVLPKITKILKRRWGSIIDFYFYFF